MSGGKVTFRKVSQFQQDQDMQRELSQLESDVQDAITEITDSMVARFRVVSLQTAMYQARLYDYVPCAGTFTVLLPTANKQNAGRPVAVLRKSGTVTVTAVTSQVQGGAADALATTGLRIYVSDGQDWWRAP